MKKTYINPEMEVIKLQTTMQMLTGSERDIAGEGSANDAEAPAAEFWDE